jgi:hypothetical protein
MDTCKNCPQILDALHISDIDPELCVEYEREILSTVEPEATTLILWEGNKSL